MKIYIFSSVHHNILFRRHENYHQRYCNVANVQYTVCSIFLLFFLFLVIQHQKGLFFIFERTSLFFYPFRRSSATELPKGGAEMRFEPKAAKITLKLFNPLI
jgi:hypothetical protein